MPDISRLPQATEYQKRPAEKRAYLYYVPYAPWSELQSRFMSFLGKPGAPVGKMLALGGQKAKTYGLHRPGGEPLKNVPRKPIAAFAQVMAAAFPRHSDWMSSV
jgi:hypothetical protein